ncbi:MAG TPA: response regulator transcription factor [Bacteroidia bacterium]|nr:response regulator transcription factor [Bacteroidia bacterium]HNP98988.1 response regulator transcription factor [Bacteroidia bacterium]
MKTKILYVEDEPFLGKVVRETLEFRGYDVHLQTDGNKVMDSFANFQPEICILDVMLPGIDGFQLAKMIRQMQPQLPIIFLTAKSQTEDLVKGFEHGGTDYIRKPFSVEELIVRVENQLRLLNPATSVTGTQEKILLGKMEFYPLKYELHTGEEIITLSYRESQILEILSLSKNQVVDRRVLLRKVWGDDSFFNSRTLDVYVRKLRNYLLADERLKIVTLKGTGYNFLVP